MPPKAKSAVIHNNNNFICIALFKTNSYKVLHNLDKNTLKSLNGYTCKHRVKPTGFHSFLHTHMLAEQKVTDNGQKIKDLQLRRAVTAGLRGFEGCDLEGKGIR